MLAFILEVRRLERHGHGEGINLVLQFGIPVSPRSAMPLHKFLGQAARSGSLALDVVDHRKPEEPPVHQNPVLPWHEQSLREVGGCPKRSGINADGCTSSVLRVPTPVRQGVSARCETTDVRITPLRTQEWCDPFCQPLARQEGNQGGNRHAPTPLELRTVIQPPCLREPEFSGSKDLTECLRLAIMPEHPRPTLSPRMFRDT